MDKAYHFVEDFPEKIRTGYNIQVPKLPDFERVEIIGMGGSFIAGILFKSLFEKEIGRPVEVSHSIKLLNNKTLYILISYSGNTKEVLLALKKLKKKKVLIITSGGKLLRKTKKVIKIQPNLHQRFTFAESFFPLVKLFEESKLIKSKTRTVNKIINTLKKNKNRINQEALLLALKLKNEHPLFYASESLYPAAYRFQTSIEEDSKILCHSNKITELFHNELESLPAGYHFPVLIIDDKETKSFKKQIESFKKQVKHFYEIGFKKYSREERMFLCFYFVDFLGYHLAKLKDKDHGETPLSDKIKEL